VREHTYIYIYIYVRAITLLVSIGRNGKVEKIKAAVAMLRGTRVGSILLLSTVNYDARTRTLVIRESSRLHYRISDK